MTTINSQSFQYGDGKTLSYLSAGPKQGPLIIFCHGWPGIGKVWKPQIETFASLGFRAVAPDMPGYGGSSSRKIKEDYSLRQINLSMVALLEHLGRDAAIWIGHDWGCGAVWSFAEHFPEKTVAVAGLAVPAHSIELGLEYILTKVDRDQYPEDEYPYGQWSYMKFYEDDFEKATAWFDKDAAAFLRAGHAKRGPPAPGERAFTCDVHKLGGWFGGIPEPDPTWKEIPAAALIIPEPELKELTTAMEKTGFWGADAWYSNHKVNKTYYDEDAKNDGYLHMPTLFIQAQYDNICDTVNSRLAEGQRHYCTNLTEVSIASGHFVAQEQPEKVSAAIIRWIVESVPKQWPGFWSAGYTKL